MERIFISYKRADKAAVFSIRDRIEKTVGVSCWIDIDGIESDAQFANVIINAINNAEVFLFMYSRSHSKIVDYDTDWTVREINFAQKKKKRIVFINLDGSSLTDWFELMFGTKQHIDASSENAMQILFRDLKKWLKLENTIKQASPTTTVKADKKQPRNQIPQSIHEAYKEGSWYFTTVHDNKTAIKYLEQAANAGHVDAQNLLGVVFYNERDYSKSLQWFKKAAAQAHPKAQYNLGKLYYKGKLGTTDYLNALKWFRISASNGNDEANNMLGVMYEEGKGVTQNYNTAYDYYLIAAKAGNPAAQYNIGCLIVRNKVTHYILNRSDAVKWFELAAKQGDKEAEIELMKLRK